MARACPLALFCCLAALATALPLCACAASPSPTAVAAADLSTGELDGRIAETRTQIASDRRQVAVQLSEQRPDGVQPLSADADFRTLADHLVALEAELEALESEREARSLPSPEVPQDDSASE